MRRCLDMDWTDDLTRVVEKYFSFPFFFSFRKSLPNCFMLKGGRDHCRVIVGVEKRLTLITFCFEQGIS